MSDFSLSRISGSDDFATPTELYQKLDAEFHFTDDPCPLGGVILSNGLNRGWGKATFVNPPYSKPGPWVRKAHMESQLGNLVVGLLRGDTSTQWFHLWVLPYAELRFIKGRLKFNGKPAPFASIIAIWRPKKGEL